MADAGAGSTTGRIGSFGHPCRPFGGQRQPFGQRVRDRTPAAPASRDVRRLRYGQRLLLSRGSAVRHVVRRGTQMQQLLKLIAAMHVRLDEFRDKERGATATEYAILVSFIALLII